MKMRLFTILFLFAFCSNAIAQINYSSDKIELSDIKLKLNEIGRNSVYVDQISDSMMTDGSVSGLFIPTIGFFGKIRSDYELDSKFRARITAALASAGFSTASKSMSDYTVKVKLKEYRNELNGLFGGSKTKLGIIFEVNSEGRTKEYEITKTLVFPISERSKGMRNLGYSLVDPVSPYSYQLSIIFNQLAIEFIEKFITDVNSNMFVKTAQELPSLQSIVNDDKKITRIELRAIQSRRFLKPPEAITNAIIALNKDNGNKCAAIAPIEYKCEGEIKNNSSGSKICIANDGNSPGKIIKIDKLEDGYCQDRRGVKYSYEMDYNYPNNTETTLRIRISTQKIPQATNVEIYNSAFKEIADGLFIDAIELTPAEMQ